MLKYGRHCIISLLKQYKGVKAIIKVLTLHSFLYISLKFTVSMSRDKLIFKRGFAFLAEKSKYVTN